MKPTKNGEIEKVVLNLERSYWQAIQNNDVEAPLKLTDDPRIVSGPQGVSSIDRPTFKRMMASAPYSLKGFQLKDEVVHLFDDEVAVVAYNVHEDLVRDGESISLDAAESSTWVKRGGRWLCCAHSESIIGDPFGRDRKAPEAHA